MLLGQRTLDDTLPLSDVSLNPRTAVVENVRHRDPVWGGVTVGVLYTYLVCTRKYRNGGLMALRGQGPPGRVQSLVLRICYFPSAIN